MTEQPQLGELVKHMQQYMEGLAAEVQQRAWAHVEKEDASLVRQMTENERGIFEAAVTLGMSETMTVFQREGLIDYANAAKRNLDNV